MKLSIIIPVYNAFSTLGKTISSIVEQTYKDWELIIVNDGSRDNSLGIALEWCTKDSRIKVLSQKNAGPGAARNYGLDEAKGEFIIFVDADDTLDNDYLETIMSPEYDNVDALLWGITRQQSVGQEVNGISENLSSDQKPEIHSPKNAEYKGKQDCRDAINSLMRGGYYGFSVVMRFRRDIIEEHHIRMATDIKLHEDLIFTNCYCQHICSLQSIDYAGYHYIQSGSSLHGRKFFQSDEMFKIALHLKGELENEKYYDALLRTKVETYLSKLTLSVKDMFNPQDKPQKTKDEKRTRIKFTKDEVTKYYSAIPHKTTYRIFRLLPVSLISIILNHG